ncbi:hypothetical protein NMG60_11001213 [Bertholletia excelsa]
MWALRRASHPLKNQGIHNRIPRIISAKLETASCSLDDKAYCGSFPVVLSDGCLPLKKFYSVAHDSSTFFMARCTFSSQADRRSSTEEDNGLEDGFSELETPASTDVIRDNDVDVENEEELVSEAEHSEEEGDDNESQHQLELSDPVTDSSERRPPLRRASSTLFRAIVAAPGLSIQSALDKWVEQGNELTMSEVSSTMMNLRKRRMYMKALQLLEHLESTKQIDLSERYYASHLDLIAKVRGLQKAEKYMEKIPKSSKGELVYRTLLANCVADNNMKKAQEVFNKMRDLEFPVTSFACNQLLLLYKRLDKKKIADVLLLMEKENVKPSLFTYKILIDTKGLSNDITGMDQIVETMKGEGIEPNLEILAIMAKHYVSCGLKEKAEAILKEMEGSDQKRSRWACRALLPLYAALGEADEVGRVWKFCESNPKLEECTAAIEAWGKLNKIEEAEAVFDKMLKTWNKLSSKHYAVLLKVYANHKMLTKGKHLVKQMADAGCRIGPLTWDALVNLYVEAGEVEKADSVLHKAAQQNQMKPLFNSFMVIMDQYAKRGDIHNTEKIFHRMRQAGYVSRLRQFQVLVQAYINAQSPAYGIRERLKADNIFPNKALAGQLAKVDAFRKTTVSDLLD